jgi:hypothetical protein
MEDKREEEEEEEEGGEGEEDVFKAIQDSQVRGRWFSLFLTTQPALPGAHTHCTPPCAGAAPLPCTRARRSRRCPATPPQTP